MSEINLPPFYIGQKVVALATSKKNDFGQFVKKGIIYTVAVQVYCCGEWNIGLKEIIVPGDGPCIMCCKSNAGRYVGGAARRFVPVHENFVSISLEKVIEEEIKLVGAN